MSRIGKQPILVPEGVNVIIEDLSVQVKGPKGALSVDIHKDMNLDLKIILCSFLGHLMIGFTNLYMEQHE